MVTGKVLFLDSCVGYKDVHFKVIHQAIKKKDWKDTGVVIFIIAPFNPPLWPLQKMFMFRRMTMESLKFSHVAALQL